MPNWCHCTIELKGPVAPLIRFRDGVKKDTESSFLTLLDSYYPIPPALRASIKEPSTLMFRYGATSVHDWYLAFWGSKWGDCHTQMCKDLTAMEDTDSLIYVFDGAWCCPCPGFREVSRQFPLLTFSLDYHEDMMGFYGSYVCKNGDVLTDRCIDMFEKYTQD